MLKEFQEFINRGNVMDLAVAVIIGGAFGSIVSSLVDDIIMPIIGLILGGVDFSGLSFGIGDAQIGYGNFIQAVVNFLIIAWVIFMMVRTINQMQARLSGPEEEEAPAGPSSEELLTEIRDLLKAQS